MYDLPALSLDVNHDQIEERVSDLLNGIRKYMSGATLEDIDDLEAIFRRVREKKVAEDHPDLHGAIKAAVDKIAAEGVSALEDADFRRELAREIDKYNNLRP